MVRRSENDEDFGNCRDGNNNMIEETLIISMILRIIEVTIFIINTSYLVGLFWIIGCEMYEDIWLD